MNGTTEEEAKGNLANLDLAYLISYAVFMFVSGWVAERMDLRYFLSGGCRSLLVPLVRKSVTPEALEPPSALETA